MKYFISGRIKLTSTLLWMILLLLSLCDTSAQYYLKSSVLSNGAVHLSNESYLISSTVGQPLIGKISTDSYRNHIGFWYYDVQSVTAIDEKGNLTLQEFELFQNYPNPFNSVTLIRYTLPKSTHVHLEVLDLLGQPIITLVNSNMPAGTHDTHFRANNIPAGYYIYCFKTDAFQEIKRMVLIK